jgi:HNH endonuclease
VELDACIEWTGSRCPRGYGRFNGVLAHRTAYIEAYGEIPEGAVIHHRCENPSCVNPAHLEAMSKRDHQRHHLVKAACSRCGCSDFYFSGERKVGCRECVKRRVLARYHRLKAST